MIGNTPGLFSIVQGAKSQAIRAASAPPTPTNIPAVPMRLGGGNVQVAGYDGTIDPSVKWATTVAPGAGSNDDTPSANPDNLYINALVGVGDITDFGSAQAMWNDMSDADKTAWRQSVQSKFYPKGGVPGYDPSGSNDAATYASIAERANEAAQQLAFDRERESHSMATATQQAAADQQKSLQDFFFNQEALKTQRKQLHNDAVTSALNAWTANVGKANVPGWQNWRMDGGTASDNIMSGAPLLDFNPLEAYGKQLSEPADIPAPNIPGIDFGQAA